VAETGTVHFGTRRPNLTPDTTGVLELTASAVEVLTIPTSQAPRFVLGTSRVCNYSGTARLFTLYYVPTGGAAGNDNIIAQHTVNATDFVQLGDIVLVSGYSLYAKADAGSALNLLLQYEQQD
jgi:hypothetical protein